QMPDPAKKKKKEEKGKKREEKALKKESVTEKFAKVQESRKRKLEGLDEEPVVEQEVEEKAVEESPAVEQPEKKKKKKKGRLEDIAEPRVETVYFDEAPSKSFADFELDERILKGIGELGWSRPTEVQLSMIDLVQEGRNVMARARTGSGKTAAYVLPVLHRVVQVMSSGQSSIAAGPLAVFVAPSKELATQIHDLITTLLRPLPFLSVLNLSSLSEEEKDVWNNDSPQLVVCTPGKLSTMLQLRPSFLSGVRHIVLDEADLLLSFGYEQEMKFIRRNLPDHYQCILTSATLTDDMTTLKKMFMTGKAVTIKLKEGDLPDSSQLTQYQISCENDEQRFAILLSLFKLKLVVGKTIIFVNTVDRCYRLALFLQGFRLKSCILNAAMPANSRCHVIAQFNKGDYPIVIASDASNVHVDGWDGEEEETKEKKKDRNRKMDKESGVARGIDFHQVSNVVNFDFPKNLESYIHRVGRTARGFNKGTALSFSIPSEQSLLEGVREEMTKQMGMDVLTPYEMRIKELDSFVLRAREAMAATTRSVVKEARLAEIRQEALRSAKLNGYFARNPRERDLLEKDKKLQQLSLRSPAIADVPDYIVPKALRGIDYSSDLKKKKKRGTKHRHKSANQRKFEHKKADPLHSFSI
ncbi:hypothetical protein PFISCL1PPCAC_23490, partial [Pristionchus fissidentatus]